MGKESPGFFGFAENGTENPGGRAASASHPEIRGGNGTWCKYTMPLSKKKEQKPDGVKIILARGGEKADTQAGYPRFWPPGRLFPAAAREDYRYFPVMLVSLRRISSGVPAAMIRPPASPPPGPMSMT